MGRFRDLWEPLRTERRDPCSPCADGVMETRDPCERVRPTPYGTGLVHLWCVSSRAPTQTCRNKMARQDANEAFAQTSFLYGGNAAYLEDLYARYSEDPASVDAEWRAFFAGAEGRQRARSPATPAARPGSSPTGRAAQRRARRGARRQLGAPSRRRSARRSRPRRRRRAPSSARRRSCRRRAIRSAP